MNFKHIQLKHRFVIHIALFLFYLALLTGIALIVQRNLNYGNIMCRSLNNLNGLLSNSYLSCNEFMSYIDTYDDFYPEGQNIHTVNFQKTLNLFNDSLSYIRNNLPLFRKQKVMPLADSVTVAAQLYGTSFNQLMLAIRELGTRNFGNIQAVRNTSREIIQGLGQLNSNELTRLASKLTGYESEFLFAANKSVFSELEYVLGDIINHPDLFAADEILAESIKGNIDTYGRQIKNINNLSERIGSLSEATGLKGELIKRYNDLNSIFDSLVNALNHENLKHKNRVIICGLFFVLLFTVLYIVLIIFLFRTIRQPLNNIIDFSYDLSKGKTPDNDLRTDLTYEYSLLSENLNSISNSLKEKRQFVEDLLKQKFKADLNLQGRVDTFGKTLIALKENMRKTRDEQLKHAEENQARRYQNEGIAKFADILRNNSDNLSKLSDVFIKEIVRYLNAIQGGLFLLEKETDKELYLASAFAYNRKKYLQKTIKLGESLVGTCALERKTINLTEIPEDYVQITSGLGDAPPTNLLLLPIMHENHLIGVLELASMKRFEENQVALGEKIADSLASTIISARINSQTAELLQKSQQQAAEMAEQEEEMRQNMEELKATQEESARREEELEGILNAIDQAFYVVEYDTEGVIQKVNQRFLYLVNLHSDKVLGKTHSQLFGKKSKADALLFANVSEGNTVELDEKVEVNNIRLDIKNMFSPIKSKGGNTIRILNIITINH